MNATSESSPSNQTEKQSPSNNPNSLHSLQYVEDKAPSQYKTQCAALAKNSFRCLEKNQDAKYNCQEHFDAYKECKKRERQAIIEERRNR